MQNRTSHIFENSSLYKIAIKKGKIIGASLVEYCILIGLITVIALGAVTLFGESVSDSFSNSSSTIAAG